MLDEDNVATSQKKQESEVVLTDLRHQFNIFELTGPKSSLILKGALTPVEDEGREELKSVLLN